MYSSTFPSPSTYRSSTMGGYTQMPSGCYRGCLTISRQANQLWKLLTSCQRQVVTTHISYYNRSTTWTTNFKILWMSSRIPSSSPESVISMPTSSLPYLGWQRTLDNSFPFPREGYQSIWKIRHWPGVGYRPIIWYLLCTCPPLRIVVASSATPLWHTLIYQGGYHARRAVGQTYYSRCIVGGGSLPCQW